MVAEANRGWILDGICRDMLPHLGPRATVAYVDPTRRRWQLPEAAAYFFSHFSLAAIAVRRREIPPRARTLVLYTHPSDTGLARRDLVALLSSSTQVLSMASMHTRQLEQWGVPPDRLTTVLGAADPHLFRGRTRTGAGAVGIVSAYYPRKDPDRVFDVVAQLADRPVLLVGRNWEHHPRLSEALKLPHFCHVAPPYQDYPSWYEKMDVFLSLSTLEGGPIPLLEAMMSNVVPVATRTGFAPDVIDHGQTGFLCDVDASVEDVVGLVRRAYSLETPVRDAVVHLTWERYARLLLDQLSF